MEAIFKLLSHKRWILIKTTTTTTTTTTTKTTAVFHRFF